MKALNILLVFMVIAASHVNAQNTFVNVVEDQYKNHRAISFTVASEANVANYRILAGNDSTNLAILGTIHSSGNSVLAKSYHYDIYQPVYAYYRVVSVGMDYKFSYSAIIATPHQEAPKSPSIDNRSIATTVIAIN